MMWTWLRWLRRGVSEQHPNAPTRENLAKINLASGEYKLEDAPPSAFPSQVLQSDRNRRQSNDAIRQAVSPQRMYSAEAVRRAWLAIKHAGGGAGMDGVTIAKFEGQLEQELAELQRLLASGQYRPKPVRQVWVPKARGGLRPLALWALRDRVAQRVVYDLLAPMFEAQFLPCSFGFRPGLGVQDAVAALQRQRDAGMRWVVDADIEDCFGAIATDRLMKLVTARVDDPLLRRYVRSWLEADIMNSADGRPVKAGTSQGSVLSPLLANVYLHQIDLMMMKKEMAYLRYADDFVICCRRRRDAEAAMQFSQTALKQWGLHLNQHKSRIVHLDQGMTWLGHFFVGNACYVL